MGKTVWTDPTITANETPVKRVHITELRATDGGVILKPENSKYQPMYYTAEDFKNIQILGKAVLFQSKL